MPFTVSSWAEPECTEAELWWSRRIPNFFPALRIRSIPSLLSARVVSVL